MAEQRSTLPDDHPYLRGAAGISPFDLAAEAIAYRRRQFEGWSMDGTDTPDPDDDDGDDEGDDDEADPESTVKVENRTFKVSELQTVMAREKRQGKKAGRTELLKELGYDSLDALRDALGSGAGEDGGDAGDDEATRKAAERERQAAEKERNAEQKARRADLRGVLREFGVTRVDLDDAFVLLDRDVDAEYEDDDLEEAVEALKQRRPNLFESPQGGDTPPPPKATLPTGGRRRRTKPEPVFGGAGMARAKRKGWVKD